MIVPSTPPALLAQLRNDADTFGRRRLAAEAHVALDTADRALAGAPVRAATLHMLLSTGERLRSTSPAPSSESANHSPRVALAP